MGFADTFYTPIPQFSFPGFLPDFPGLPPNCMMLHLPLVGRVGCHCRFCAIRCTECTRMTEGIAWESLSSQVALQPLSVRVAGHNIQYGRVGNPEASRK